MRRPYHDPEGQDGAISVMAAVIVFATLLATSLAVDVGRVAYVSRDQQGATDRAVLDTIRVLEDSTAGTLTGLETELTDAVEESLARNPESGTSDDRTLSGIELGMVQNGTQFVAICGTRPPSDWFDTTPAALPTCADADAAGTWAAGDVNALQVYVGSTVPYLFALGAEESGREIRKWASGAVGDPIGAVSAATREVELSDGLVTALLSELLGADAELTLVGWNGLADLHLTLRDLAANVGAGTVGQLLQTELTVGELADAAADVLAADSDTSADARATLTELANATLGVGLGPVALGDLVTIDPQSGDSALDASVDVAGLLLGFAQVANHEHAGALDLSALGVSNVSATLIEAPQIAIGRPGQNGSGTWHTQAKTAQVRLDVDLDLASIASGIGVTDLEDEGILPEAQSFRDRIDAISSCTAALVEGDDNIDGTIASDLGEAIEHARTTAQNEGLLTSTAESLLDGALGLLDGLLGVLGCATTPDSTLTSIQSDLHSAVDDYEQALDEMSNASSTPQGGTDPVLSVALASGEVALEEVRCTDPMEADTFVEGRAADVVLTTPTEIEADPFDPMHVQVDLLEVDLGLLGDVDVDVASDESLGTNSGTLNFAAAWPADAQVLNANTLGIGSLLGAVNVDASGTALVGLPLGDVELELENAVEASLGSVLGDVDSQVLSPLLDVLGIDLGNVHARVLDATCEGPPRLLPRG